MKLGVTSLIVAATIFGASAAMAAPHHMGGDGCNGSYCDGPYYVDGHRGDQCMYRRHNGPRFYFNSEEYRNDPKFQEDFAKVQSLKDELFIQRQILKSVINRGADEKAVRAAAEKVIEARDAFRAGKTALFDKIYSYETNAR